MRHFSFVFPGQGSQKLGMAAAYADANPAVKGLFDLASECLGYDLWEVVTEDSEQRLNRTEYTQPALLVAGVAAWQTWLTQRDDKPTVIAGHSLGEYTALVCAGAMRLEDAVRLVAARGRLMQEAVNEGEGAMAAIVGLDDSAVNDLCLAAASEGIVAPANYNSVGQVVIAGQTAAVTKAEALAKEKGAKMAVRLPVSVPSHCELMRPAAEQLNDLLQAVNVITPEIPVINNADVVKETDPEAIKRALVKQLYSPVRWVETVRLLQAEVSLIGECGPGKVLSGLIKRIDRSLTAKPLNSAEEMAAFQALYTAE